jgi:hypothetical protein
MPPAGDKSPRWVAYRLVSSGHGFVQTGRLYKNYEPSPQGYLADTDTDDMGKLITRNLCVISDASASIHIVYSNNIG